MNTKGITYAGTGVDYSAMDPFKREAQFAAVRTQNAQNLIRNGMREVTSSRGESAYLIETKDSYLAHVEEGLGTKNKVAAAMYALTGKSYYDQIAQDTVAMIVNDIATLGALPFSVAMHLAVGDSKWFDDKQRSDDLIRGWKRACDLSCCAWSGGETPTLKDVVLPDSEVLSGSAVGIINPKSFHIQGDIQDGDAIILIESSGIHANGLTLAREIAGKLPQSYSTELPNGRTYGETLLDPTLIYVPIIAILQRLNTHVHYAVNITGHGWRKLMRASAPFTYIIDMLPTQLPIFDFIQKCGPVDDREAYGNLNMGAGFALYVSQEVVSLVLRAINNDLEGEQYFHAFVAGHIEKSDRKKVVICPKNLEYDGSELQVR